MQNRDCSKAQGAIEYLLIIGAAILIVAIVILAVTGILSGGQSSTETSNQSAIDALRGLKVTGIGYVIEMELADGSVIWNVGDTTFPAPPQAGDCGAGCYQEKTIVRILVDDVEVEAYDMSGIRELKTFTYVFKGDPNTFHTLKIRYGDCCCAVCSDGGIWDRNLKIGKIKITNSTGKESVITPGVDAYGNVSDMNFK